jgi:hypothetical protein
LRDTDADNEEEMKYQFIGEAYVHGIMTGEAVDEKDVDLKSIILV